jgi:hypothetical protein
MTNGNATPPAEAGPLMHRRGALHAHNGTGPSAEVCFTGNSNPELGLFGGTAKGVK